ncbi:hypothetical protein V6N13_033644 [Hibiscus sabdariffa]
MAKQALECDSRWKPIFYYLLNATNKSQSRRTQREHKYEEMKALQQTSQGDDLKVQLHCRAKSPLADSRLACSLPKEICPAILLHYNFNELV